LPPCPVATTGVVVIVARFAPAGADERFDPAGSVTDTIEQLPQQGAVWCSQCDLHA